MLCVSVVWMVTFFMKNQTKLYVRWRVIYKIVTKGAAAVFFD